MQPFPELTLGEEILNLISQNEETLNSWDIHRESRGSCISSMAKPALE